MGGIPLVSVKKIGAFTILPNEGLLRCIDSIGRFNIIAPGIQIGNPQHCTEAISPHPMFGMFDSEWTSSFHSLYQNKEWIMKIKRKQIEVLGDKISGFSTIGNDVWIGYGAIIRRGCNIGDGAIVGAGAVVTEDVPPYAIVGGVPAKILRFRYKTNEIEKLLQLKWWKYGPDILNGVDIMNVEDVINKVSERIEKGFPEYNNGLFVFDKDGYRRINRTFSL